MKGKNEKKSKLAGRFGTSTRIISKKLPKLHLAQNRQIILVLRLQMKLRTKLLTGKR